MSDLWGFQSGQQQRQVADDQHALVEASIIKSTDEHAQAGVALESSEMTLAAQKQMLQLMQKKGSQQDDQEEGGAPELGGTEQSNEIPDGLDALARMALASGLPQQASDYASKASTIRNNAATIKEKESKLKIQELTMATGMLENVKDEKSWNQANSLYEMTTGQKSPFAGMAYSPDKVEQIRGSLQTQKDKALTAAAKARTQASIAATKEREARIPLINAQRELTETRDANLRKAGATGVMPKAEDLRAITDLISKEYGGSVSNEDARVLARPVAERMMALMKVNQLTRSEASQRAFQEAAAAGTFGGLRKKIVMPGTVEKPLAMPTDKAKLKENMYYLGKGKYEGQKLLWLGDKFIPSTSPILQPAEGDDGEGPGGFDNEHTPDVDESQ